MTALVALGIAAILMLVELRVSRRHEEVLRAQGAIVPPDPVYQTMRWAYPGVFVLMTAEGLLAGTPGTWLLAAGAVLFTLAKLLKAWAILTLGTRWTYRVYVLPGAPLVTHGPYRWLRHPNYLGVVGELVGFALMVQARVTGIVAVLFFGELLRRRIHAEEQALGLRQ